MRDTDAVRPANRNADLDVRRAQFRRAATVEPVRPGQVARGRGVDKGAACRCGRRGQGAPGGALRMVGRSRVRSEEHTSELQSHVNLVCRLLLEKKKKK